MKYKGYDGRRRYHECSYDHLPKEFPDLSFTFRSSSGNFQNALLDIIEQINGVKDNE